MLSFDRGLPWLAFMLSAAIVEMGLL